MSAVLWFVVGLFVGVGVGFMVFAMLQLARGADDKAAVLSNEDAAAIAERIAAGELRRLSLARPSCLKPA